jgi:Family of unknown function (DUF6644)
MAHALDLAAAWIKHTGIGAPMTATPWLWPLCETLHFIGLALLIGVAGLFDLRMLGFVRRVSLAAVMELRPWAALGLAINLVTGVMFFVGAPDQYVHNPAWWAKVAFILIAGLNILAFELSPRAKALVQEVGPGDNTPLRLKLAGGVSLFSWFAVLYFGRMLPFIGNAF